MSDAQSPDAAALYRLMAWLSPAYPVGAFSYSSGIEWAVEAGDIKDAATLRDWLCVMLAEGGGFHALIAVPAGIRPAFILSGSPFTRGRAQQRFSHRRGRDDDGRARVRARDRDRGHGCDRRRHAPD